MLSKNKKNNFVSRNKNQSLDFIQYTNNPNNNANKTQFKSGIHNNKNKEIKKIRLTNNALFRSMKSINNNKNNKFY